ncbi:MAG: sigma-70 family RNA polymerase sigma factor [Halobacteriovoraceae bacterium]|jgi:RNA polymerase sigma-70 factor, ECF subfamily|nr:sigma-70 family RNA polymerase sigma factor [Halobacteriovoraceae bacterium]
MEAFKTDYDLDLLYRQMSPGLIGNCRKKGLSEEEALDLVHSSFLTLIEALPRFKGQSKLSTFFYGIYLNKLREFYRSKKRLTLIVEKVESNIEECTVQKKQESEDPARHSEINQSLNQLSDAVATLKPRTEEIFLKRFVLGISNKQLAEEFQLKENNIRQILLRARNSIVESCLLFA